MKPMADLLRNHQKTRLETAVWAAKIVFLFIGIASTAVLTATFGVPYFLSLLSSSLPKLCNSILSWFVPPYLFITVHFIIIIIWKLHGNQRQEEEKSPDAPPLPLKPTNLETSPAVSLESKTSSEISQEIPPSPTISGENPPESDEKSGVEIKKSIEPPETKEGKGDESSSSSSGPDTMDAMWKAIMEGGSAHLQKSKTWKRSSDADHAEATRAKKEMRKWETWRRREVLVVGHHDELFGRVEAFIKMNYDQMRLQRQAESEQRYVEMVNAAY